MLDSHPTMAVSSSTFFVSEIIKRAGQQPDAEQFCRILTRSSTWNDHGLSAAALRNAVRGREPFSWASGLRAFYRLYASRLGKSRVGDATPRYGYHMIGIVALLPEARFVHVIRDGRDAAVFHRATHGWARYGSVEKHAKEWRTRIRSYWYQALYVSYLEVRYEDFVRNREEVARQLCKFLDLAYDSCMLSYYKRSAERLSVLSDIVYDLGHITKADRLKGVHANLLSKPPDPSVVGRWKTELMPEEAQAYEEVAGDLLKGLGYDLQ